MYYIITINIINNTSNKKMFNVLDVCCGGKMFWFDKKDERTVFVDKRIENLKMKDSTSKYGYQFMEVRPDVQSDFTALPFRDESFNLVVFDPPHLRSIRPSSWLAKKYGVLTGNWEFEIGTGFVECFRVLRPAGILIFKWSDIEIPISRILDLVKEYPLFGHMSGKKSKTHWVSFIKKLKRKDE